MYLNRINITGDLSDIVSSTCVCYEKNELKVIFSKFSSAALIIYPEMMIYWDQEAGGWGGGLELTALDANHAHGRAPLAGHKWQTPN